MITYTGYEIYIGKSEYDGGHSHWGNRDNWNMLLSLEGEFRLGIGGKRLHIGPDVLFMIEPGPPRRFLVQKHWLTYWLHFNMDAHIHILPELPAVGEGVYSVDLVRDDFGAVRRVFEELFRVCNIRRHGWYLLAYHLVQELILRGNMACQATLGEHIETTAKMLENLDTSRSINDIAGKCAMSRSDFFVKFRSTFGTTPAKYREQQTLSQAQSLLENSDMSIKEIAQTLHICQPCYLASRFRKAFGVSPREYRRRHRAENAGSGGKSE